MKKQTKNSQKKMTTIELAKLVVALYKKTDKKIDKLAEATAKGFESFGNELRDFKEETKSNFARIDENFTKIRRDILNIKDTYATKEELAKVSVRIDSLEKKR